MRVFTLVFILSVVFTLALSSCIKTGRCDEPPNVYNSGIVATFKDSVTGRYLYEVTNPLYNKDSLKVFDSIGNPLRVETFPYPAPGNPSLQIYVTSFGSICNPNTDAASFTSEINKALILQYKYNERDTIRVSFKSKSTKCGTVFETLRIYHKSQLLTSVSNSIYAEVTIIKN
jgi:hypothetical protein